MKQTRTITIVCHGGNHFDVHEGETFSDHLCWDEMLGQIASLTHPQINRWRYRMNDADEHLAERERHRLRMEEIERQQADESARANCPF